MTGWFTGIVKTGPQKSRTRYGVVEEPPHTCRLRWQSNSQLQKWAMAIYSDIGWTDATWNPVRGCTKISPGCKHCCAETFAERFRGVKGHPYEHGFDPRLVPEKLIEPLRW